MTYENYKEFCIKNRLSQSQATSLFKYKEQFLAC